MFSILFRIDFFFLVWITYLVLVMDVPIYFIIPFKHSRFYLFKIYLLFLLNS